MSCFKKIHGTCDVYYRHVKNNSGWDIATDRDTANETSGVFYDDNNEQHYLKNIAGIGVDGRNITVLYVYDGWENEYDMYPNQKVINVTDAMQVNNVLAYFDSKKCTKD